MAAGRGARFHPSRLAAARRAPQYDGEFVARDVVRDWFCAAICYPRHRSHHPRSFAMTTMLAAAPEPPTVGQTARWLAGRSFASWREEFDRQGYLVFERVLAPEFVEDIRTALAPHLAREL